MKTQQKTNKTLIAAMVTAIAASLCCITPVLALLAGVGSIASAFSWLEPYRPYLVCATILILGFAWYQILKLKRKDEIECECEEKPSFWQSKLFLGIVTVLAILLLAFPQYSHIFYPKTESKVVTIETKNVVTANFDIEGMTCPGCEEHIKNAVAKLDGFLSAEANHKTGKATVKFDKSKTSLEQIVAAINETGYKVTKQEELKK